MNGGDYAGGSRTDETLKGRDRSANRNFGPGDTYWADSPNMKRDETELIRIVNSPNNKQKISNMPRAPGKVYRHMPYQ